MNTVQFLQENIDTNARISPLEMKTELSPAINSRYAFWQLNLLNNTFLLASPAGQFTVKGLIRDFAEVELKTNKVVILYTETLSPYIKQRLISEQVPFLLFDKQFFLPILMMNIKAGSSKPIISRDVLTPAAQTVFLSILYASEDNVTQLELQEKLHLSAISASRAVEELRSLDLIEAKIGGKTNRKKEIVVSDYQAYYRKGMRYFGRGTKQRIYCKGDSGRGLLLSGLSALSKRTMINPPSHKSYALYSRKLKSANLHQISKDEYLNTKKAFCVDLLTYDPTYLALDDMVDPVTMLITLHEHDERIDSELDSYLKGFAWYTD